MKTNIYYRLVINFTNGVLENKAPTIEIKKYKLVLEKTTSKKHYFTEYREYKGEWEEFGKFEIKTEHLNKVEVIYTTETASRYGLRAYINEADVEEYINKMKNQMIDYMEEVSNNLKMMSYFIEKKETWK